MGIVMKQNGFEKRSVRRLSKKKHNKRFINLIVMLALFISVFAYATNIAADNKKKSSEVSVELNVEKLDRDTVKIELDNFNPVVRSLQLSVKINGNVNFKEESIKWRANSDSNDVKTHVKINNDKNNMQIFIVSTEALNKNGGKLEICKIDVVKASNGSSTYTIDANVNSDEVSYSYIVNDTNKQVSGIDMANLSEEKLTINSLPVISLKSSSSIIDGNIVVSKGSTFEAKSYVEVNDEEDGEISVDNVIVTGKVDTKKVGTYNIKYSVTDSEGDSAILDQIVIVEEVIDETDYGDDTETPELPGNPEVPGDSDNEDKPELPETPDTPEDDDNPGQPEVPEQPEKSGNGQSQKVQKYQVILR